MFPAEVSILSLYFPHYINERSAVNWLCYNGTTTKGITYDIFLLKDSYSKVYPENVHDGGCVRLFLLLLSIIFKK